MTEKKALKITNKVDLSLVPIEAVAAIGRGTMLGEVKYDKNDWTYGHKASALCAAILRHVLAYANGLDTDDEGFDNLDNAITTLALLIAQRDRGTLIDDRCYENGKLPFKDYSQLILTDDFKAKLQSFQDKKAKK